MQTFWREKSIKDVDQARKYIFWNALKKKKSVIDLSLLPPCKRSLRFHVRRTNYVSFIWRQSTESVMISDLPQNHGWDQHFDFAWAEELFPQDVSTFLSEFSNRTNDGDEESEYEEEFDLIMMMMMLSICRSKPKLFVKPHINLMIIELG